MPILHVRALPEEDHDKIKNALKMACEAIANAYGCQESHVWATWEEITPGFYIEGSCDSAFQPADTHPPICELVCFEGKNDTKIEEVLLATSKALGEGLGLENNIFVSYREAKAGQAVIGNRVVGKN